MENKVHTVLGASGASGRAVVSELIKLQYKHIRVVNRSAAQEKNNNLDYRPADLLDLSQTRNAIRGSDIVYVCTAVSYKASLWEKLWPVMIQNIIAACLENNAKMVFLDNVYMYGPAPLAIPFDENHPQLPASRKGKVRKKVADLILDQVESRQLQAVIARSADFYGPHAVYSPFYFSMIQRMLQGKAPQALSRPQTLHTYAYTVDNARAMVALAHAVDINGQVFHLPVGEPITTEGIVDILNEELGTRFKTTFLPPAARKMLSLFVPVLREVGEMNYQFEAPYIMNTEKFKKLFPDFKVTPYQEGIRQMIASFI